MDVMCACPKQCNICYLPVLMLNLFVVQSVFDIITSDASILGVGNTCDYDSIIPLVSFLICKQWLLLPLEKKSRSNIIALQSLEDELSFTNL